MIAIYVDHELMDSAKNERESDREGEEKIIPVLMYIIFVYICIIKSSIVVGSNNVLFYIIS